MAVGLTTPTEGTLTVLDGQPAGSPDALDRMFGGSVVCRCRPRWRGSVAFVVRGRAARCPGAGNSLGVGTSANGAFARTMQVGHDQILGHGLAEALPTRRALAGEASEQQRQRAPHSPRSVVQALGRASGATVKQPPEKAGRCCSRQAPDLMLDHIVVCVASTGLPGLVMKYSVE
jgi:hypothetical protein